MSKHTTLTQLRKLGARTKAELDALRSKLGTLPEGKDVAQVIAEMKTAASYDDTAIQARIDTLVGTDANKSVRTIASEELARQLIPEDAKESLDTVAELAAWFQNHPDDVGSINKAITDLTAVVGALPEDTAATTVVGFVKEYTNAAIAALNIGDYAKAADLTALAARVAVLEGSSHTHANKAVLDSIEVASDDEVDAMLTEVFGAVSA